ncbi:protein shisa-9A [Electrophorus electricus]|uniref:Shisa N-terminal domain-containing protein n=1 Tax=Electrophorus electricus TaxID=8005 RepID=A0A4W4F8D1_ELEEL|nr:protein shisa-9A [Electrophorus electricus]
MRWTVLLLEYLLVKVMVLVCKADGEPEQQLEGFFMLSGTNGSRENGVSESPHTQDECRGYYDVMGQWDPPFVCQTGNYLYCCGTCGFRFCCAYKNSRLDQSTCKNYDTPVWLKGQTPYKKTDPRHDPTRDKTNLIVYVICGVVAIMALVGIFTKLGLEKAQRPHRENMSRAVASVMQGACQAEHEEAIGMHAQHYDNVQARANTMQVPQIHSVGQARPYPALSQLAHVYEQQQQTSKELNKYATLKAVAAKANGDFYNKQHHHLTEMAAKGSLPLHTMRVEHVEPTASYVTELPCPKQNGQKPKAVKSHVPHHVAYSSNTIATTGMLRGWDATETLGRRKSYGPKKPCAVGQMNQLNPARSHHYLPTQPYFVTNSKTEVTV